MNPEQIKKDWESRGHSFRIIKDPPGQIWSNFVQKTYEIVVLAGGEVEIKIKDTSRQPPIGKEVFIPVKAIHTVRNIGNRNNVWYYGYKEISVVSL